MTKGRSKYTKESAIGNNGGAGTQQQQENGHITGMTEQEEFMESDTVLVLDSTDTVIGSASKYESHLFDSKQSHGILHRAFSVFLFDVSTNKLLLHKRAADKITFPNVWTNTCCSHPLHGMEPSEVDTEIGTSDAPSGIKNAAIRKLQQELGIPKEQSSTLPIKFLTRLHYWAADTITHGPESPWGEHEIDYVLFMSVPTFDAITIQPNPTEIDEIKWVSKSELDDMLSDSTILFSPWFRIIYQTWIKTKWWEDDISVTINTNKYVDRTTIHRFDPPTEHYGGAGNARPMFTNLVEDDMSKKQGSYGKIKTHSESKLRQILHLDEMWAAIQVLYVKPLQSNVESSYITDRYNSDDLKFCDAMLVQVSRSFAAVIRQLPDELLVDVAIFYLVLRALDTIEDDMQAFESNEIKIHHLHTFHEKLDNPNWFMDGVGHGHERKLLQKFYHVARIYQQLTQRSQDVIVDITKRMAYGMAEFVSCDLGQGTATIAEYNKYCHYVAGLVGEGLSRLFVATGLEPEHIMGTNESLVLADQMGLFLQKTNIIRDFLEDYVDQRAFWPQSVWKKYSETGNIGYFALNSSTSDVDKNIQYDSLYCLNELITDALELVPDCFQYMCKLTQYEIFRFCAIPQVMAIATLEKCYNNIDVFTGVVKIRKGLSCKLILRTNNLQEVYETFYHFAMKIKQRAIAERCKGFIDPNYDRTISICDTICDAVCALATFQQPDALITKQVVRSPASLTPITFAYWLSYPIIGSCWFWPYITTPVKVSSERERTHALKGDLILRSAGLIVSASIFYYNRPGSIRTTSGNALK